MSLWDYLFDNEWRQRSDIEELKQRTARARIAQIHTQSRAQRKQEELEQDIGTLALFCRTTITLMLEKGLVTREEFLARMAQVGASDGKIDGRYTGQKSGV
ncbi:MAG: hypothetical protein NTW87_29800 [Planctomycetota bacterium]|nr:hypothetical protein [Planctomycetota bacterium]